MLFLLRNRPWSLPYFNPALTTQTPVIQYLCAKPNAMKKILFTLFLIVISSSGYSQNILQGDAQQDLEIAAREAAERWTTELAMSAKQTALMEDKLVEYAIKKQEVLNSKMREELKTQRLLELEYAENQSMQDILTQPQFERYIFLLRQEVKRKSANIPKDSTSKKE